MSFQPFNELFGLVPFTFTMVPSFLPIMVVLSYLLIPVPRAIVDVLMEESIMNDSPNIIVTAATQALQEVSYLFYRFLLLISIIAAVLHSCF